LEDEAVARGQDLESRGAPRRVVTRRGENRIDRVIGAARS
jgi:hypothetical protein